MKPANRRSLAEVVDELRSQGVAGLGSTRGFYAGPLFVVAEGGDMSGIVIGARTGSQGGGGQYSVFYNAVPEGAGFSQVAWVEGLQQDRENRSNLALVNTGEVDGSASVFHLEIYDGETGLLAETVVTKPIPARRWHQINGILGSYAPETRQGYIRIEKVSGEKSLPGLRGGQRRRRPGRAQRRRSLPAGDGVGGLTDSTSRQPARIPHRGVALLRRVQGVRVVFSVIWERQCVPGRRH